MPNKAANKTVVKIKIVINKIIKKFKKMVTVKILNKRHLSSSSTVSQSPTIVNSN